jgi:hypothetical protein
MPLSDLVIIALATWAAQYVVRWESGPFGIFDWVRETIFGVRIVGDPEEEAVAVPVRPGTLADLITCIYCTGFWVAVIMVAMNRFIAPVVWVFAALGLAVLIEQIKDALYGSTK